MIQLVIRIGDGDPGVLQIADGASDVSRGHSVPRIVVEKDYEDAAITANRCRSAGIAGSAIDLLICATSMRRGWPIFTTDKDFRRYAQHAPIRLHMQPAGVGE